MDKQELLNTYLDDQTSALQQDEGSSGGALQTVEVPNNDELEEFKTKVRYWMEIDNTVKKLRGIIRERNQAKKELTSYILNFMSKFNIEDLNTKEGKLRYKVSSVKAPLSQQVLKERLLENYSTGITPDELIQKVFENRGIVEKHSLKRLKPPKVLTI